MNAERKDGLLASVSTLAFMSLDPILVSFAQGHQAPLNRLQLTPHARIVLVPALQDRGLAVGGRLMGVMTTRCGKMNG